MDPKASPDAERLLAELDALIGPLPAPEKLRAIVSPPPKPRPPAPPPAREKPRKAAPEPEKARKAASEPPPKKARAAAPPPPAPPLEEELAVEAPATSPAAPRLLIVEDNKDYRKVLRFLFASHGYSVIDAGDGVEGLQVARAQRPDLALLDFDMPRMNGYELLQELRRADETRHMPVIFLTGASNRATLREMGLDVARFLDKPVPNSDLLKAVDDVLGAPPPPPSAEAAAEEVLPEGILDVPDAGGDELLIEEQKKDREEDVSGLDVLANDSPLVNRINKLLVQAVEMGASDVHIEPQEKAVLVRVRVDGTLRLLQRLPIALQAQIAARVKIMSNLVITERRRPQDGQIRAVIKGRKIEFRVSTIPALYGEKVVLRILGGAKLKEKLEELQLCERDLEVMRKALQSPHGLLLVTGPTGSGKSTTLYTMIRQLNTPDVNIMTAEDPVEYELAGITQVPVRAAIGVTFEAILRSFLRQDPDVMLVGEIRDLETAEIAVKAAITGHVVLSTLHTNSAPAAIMRLTHMGLAPYLVADSVKLIVAQRLVRRICPHCRAPSPPSEETLRLLGVDAERLAGAQAGRGCSDCGRSGYAGRMPLFEVMDLRTPEMRALILSEAGVDKIARRAEEEGMRSLREAALDAVAQGQTTVEEALSVALSD